MKSILAIFVVLLATVTANAQDVTISPPTFDSDGVLQQFAEVDDGPMDHYWYWLYSSDAEGTMYFRAESDTMPVLNLDNPAWQEIDPWAYSDDLSFRYDVPSAQEAAWLTDAIAYTKTGNFLWAYYLIWWDDYDYLELLTLSELY